MTTQPTTAPTRGVRAGAYPLAPAGASYLGAALSILLILGGAAGIREALVALGWISGDRWLAPVVTAVDGASPTPWMAPAAAAVGVVGVLVMVIALKPRRRRAVAAQASSAVYVDLTEVARVASAAAEAVPGVVSARTTASKRSLTVRCEVTGQDDEELKDRVANAAASELEVLVRTPRIRVRLSKGN